jgi:hypothetical protein
MHLFEFNDQPWLPSIFRNALTAYLNVAYRSTPFGGMFAQRVAALLTLTGSNKIVDLCSGSGGPIAIVYEQLKSNGGEPHITMTDLFPNTGARGGPIDYWPQSVDVRNVPPQLTGMRTMFASFHHFKAKDATLILRNAFDQRCTIAVFEVTARTPVGILGAILIPFGVLLMTPRIRPLSLFQVVFTYLIPILPVMIFWDGLISQIRTYSPDEMRAMTKGMAAPDYEWECGTMKVPGTPLSVPYLTGMPL